MILARVLAQTWVILKSTGQSFYHDNGYFLAMGLAFNLLLYLLPLILLMISLLGYTVLESEKALLEVQSVLYYFLPHSDQALDDNLAAIVRNRELLGLVGFCFLLIFSSTLFGSVRHILNIVFKAERRRGFLHGLGHDFLMMLATALMSLLAIAVTSLIALARSTGAEYVPRLTPAFEPLLAVAEKLLAVFFLFAIFYVFYRFAPMRTLQKNALLIAAASATILFELTRWGFAWYVGFARASLPLYGALTGLMFFFFWLYYASIIFVVGAEIGFAYAETRQNKTG